MVQGSFVLKNLELKMTYQEPTLGEMNIFYLFGIFIIFILSVSTG